VKSIQKHAAGTKIHILDDGKAEWRFSANHPDTAATVDKTIETEFDIGISEGRNRLVDSVETPYLMLIDDDHVLTRKTKLVEMLNRFVDLGDRCDLLAFGARYVPRCFAYSKWKRTIYAINKARETENGIQWCDLVTNAFIAKPEPVRKVRWDARIKTGEHWDFFLRAMRQGMKVAMTRNHDIDHLHVNNDAYTPIRYKKARRRLPLRLHGLNSFKWHNPPQGVVTVDMKPSPEPGSS